MIDFSRPNKRRRNWK